LSRDSDAVYERRVVAFLDILGFRSLIQATETDIALRKKIHSQLLDLSKKSENKFLGIEVRTRQEDRTQTTGVPWSVAVERLAKGESAQLKTIYAEDLMEATVFSDSIVLSAVLDPEHPGTVFGVMNLGTVCARLSKEMLSNGYPIRGGIAYGDLYHDGQVVFGPALVEAYDLEHLHAVNPRIIFSKKAAGLFRFAAQRPAVDADGWEYLDIFGGSTVKELNRLREQTVEAFRHRSDERIRSKWLWLQRKLDSELDPVKDGAPGNAQRGRMRGILRAIGRWLHG